MEDDTPRLPPPEPPNNPSAPHTVLVVQHPDTPPSDRNPALHVTWQDEVQEPPAPPQRVEIELLPDDNTPPFQMVPALSSTVDQTVYTVLVQLGTGEAPKLDL